MFAPIASQGQPPASSIGRNVYENVCAACHAPHNVMVSSPKAGDIAEWTRRLAKGLDQTTDNAVNEVGAMPPKGGASQLAREETREAILSWRSRTETVRSVSRIGNDVPSHHDYLWIVWINTLLHELGVPVPMLPTAMLAGASAAAHGASPLSLIAAVVAGTILGNAVGSRPAACAAPAC